jgi:hypothetical protein
MNFLGGACGGLYVAETLSVSAECKLVAVNLSKKVRKMSLIFSSDHCYRAAAADNRHPSPYFRDPSLYLDVRERQIIEAAIVSRLMSAKPNHADMSRSEEFADEQMGWKC